MVSRNLHRSTPFLFISIVFISVLYSIASAGGSITTIIILRHAEKDTMRYDPPLTSVGRERARALAHVLEGANVSALYTTQFVRTQQTVQTFAEKLGIKPTIFEVDPKNIKGHAEELAKVVLSRHASQTVVISSHSNVIPLIIEALKAGPRFEISDDEYDNLFVITIGSTGETQLLRLKFGKPSS